MSPATNPKRTFRVISAVSRIAGGVGAGVARSGFVKIVPGGPASASFPASWLSGSAAVGAPLGAAP